jgi:hypothetical protein
MAESVKRRVAAARLAVAFVAAGTIAGATAWASASPPPTAHSSASDIFAKIGDIKSENIADGSLLYKDFKKGEVPSFKQFVKLDETFFKYKKAVNSFKYDADKKLGDVNGDISTIKGELGGYIKLSDADARYIKMNDAIMGDGSVFTATGESLVGKPAVRILDVPNLFTVDAAGPVVTITNTSGGTLEVSKCPAPGGQTTNGGGTLINGGTLVCDGSSGFGQTVQLISAAGTGGGPHVSTLNFSAIPTQGGTLNTVQILIGL